MEFRRRQGLQGKFPGKGVALVKEFIALRKKKLQEIRDTETYKKLPPLLINHDTHRNQTLHKEGTTLDLAFLEGCVKRYDALSLSDKFPQLLALKDRKLFSKGKLMGFGGVVWNEDLDIDSETIYEEGTDVTSEYPDLPLYQLGYRVKQARLEREMSQEELSNASGIQQADISRIEKGSANPSVKTLIRIANALGAPLLITFTSV